METWYRARIYGPSLEAIEAERSTDTFVVINGRRCSKYSACEQYFTTRSAAEKWLHHQVMREIDVCNSRLETAKEKLAKVEKLCST